VRRWLPLWAALAASACHVPIAHVDEIALAPASGPLVRVGPAEGRDCRWWVLGVPLGLPRIDAALASALAAAEAGVLRDVVVTSEHPAYGPFGRHCYGVRGVAWR
jgi:hypothetical protein